MKSIKNKSILIGGFAVLVAIAACKKSFLDKPPLGTLSPEILATETGVQGLLIGAYSMVDGTGGAVAGYAGGAASNWVFGGVASDDAYKGSDPSDFTELVPFEQYQSMTPVNDILNHKWRANYAGAQRSNEVLRTMAIAQGIPAATATQIEAQARFLRAHFHFELRRVFGNIIYADETVTPENTAVTNTQETYPRIEEDLTFAVANLPESWGAEVGRANKWAAMATLAKVYMHQNKHAEAYPLLKDIIANGKTARGDKYALFPRYYSNFNPAQKNGPESVWAAQTSVQDNSSIDWGGDPNGNFGDVLNFPYNGGPGACCGFYNPSQDLGNAYKTNPTTGLPLLDESYAQGLNVSSATNPYTGTLDPRIDWVMGRPGIPYLDWGLHPGEDWIRNPVNNGRFSPKKNVYAQSQKDTYTDVGSGYWGPNELVANNVNIIRFADVILWAAEAAAKAGETANAMMYVNMIRERAANPDGWVYSSGTPSTYNAAIARYTVQTTPAANYRIGLYTSATFNAGNAMDAIRFERRLELAMEGHRFFDLQRYNKETPGFMATVLNRYIDREKALRPLLQDARFTQGRNEIFPIPQTQIDQMNADGTKRLTQNPGY